MGTHSKNPPKKTEKEEIVKTVLPVVSNANNTVKEIILSDGRKVVIRKGKGRDSIEASKNSGNSGEKYIAALIAQLITIDGQRVVLEDLEEMDLKDYTAIQAEFSEINF